MQPDDKMKALIEAKILEVLKHPNIIGFIEQYTSGQRSVLNVVIEYAGGGDLSAAIKERKKDDKYNYFTEDEVLNIFT